MSRQREVITTVVVLTLLIGGVAWALVQIGVLKECMALLSCG